MLRRSFYDKDLEIIKDLCTESNLTCLDGLTLHDQASKFDGVRIRRVAADFG